MSVHSTVNKLFLFTCLFTSLFTKIRGLSCINAKGKQSKQFYYRGSNSIYINSTVVHTIVHTHPPVYMFKQLFCLPQNLPLFPAHTVNYTKSWFVYLLKHTAHRWYGQKSFVYHNIKKMISYIKKIELKKYIERREKMYATDKGACIYWDKSSMGCVKKHRPRNRWRADITICGQRYRKRDKDRSKLVLWLDYMRGEYGHQ